MGVEDVAWPSRWRARCLLALGRWKIGESTANSWKSRFGL